MQRNKMSNEERKTIRGLLSGRTRVPTANSPGEKLMDVLTAIACVVLVFSLLRMAFSIRDDYTGVLRRRDADYALRRQEYSEIVEDYYRRHADIAPNTSTEKDLAAFARYVQAAFLYKAALETGDADRAGRHKTTMDTAYSEMGIYRPETDVVLSRLGLEKTVRHE